MTNVQKWILAALVIFIGLFILGKATENNEPAEDAVYYEEAPAQTDGASQIQNLFTVNNCFNCHGSDLKGTTLGPTLYTAGEYWDRADLINYLRNPADYSGDERFEAFKERYNHIVMPSYDNVDVKELGKMADYILSLQN